jgi:hypothetical protein
VIWKFGELKTLEEVSQRAARARALSVSPHIISQITRGKSPASMVLKPIEVKREPALYYSSENFYGVLVRQDCRMIIVVNSFACDVTR